MIDGNEVTEECARCGAHITFYTTSEGVAVGQWSTLFSFIENHVFCEIQEEEDEE